MAPDYEFSISDCDVASDRRSGLQSFRDKRSLWLSWIDTDEYHAISNVISAMVWSDVAFRTLSHLAMNDDRNALNNTILSEGLINGHIAIQILAIRRLMDNRKDGIISLRKLLKDIRNHFNLFTRENYVCFDGLPYDYDSVQQEIIDATVGSGLVWGSTSGPKAYSSSQMAHQRFDKLAGIDPAHRTRRDRLPKSLLKTVESWLDNSVAVELANWSHVFLAHAGGQRERSKIPDNTVTMNKISEAIKILARVTEAVSAWLLCGGSLDNSLMPIAQFNQFEMLDGNIMHSKNEAEAERIWRQLSDERNNYLDELEVSLIVST